MRHVPLALVLALGLAACDSGHRDDPAGDNRWMGPDLAVQLPGPDTTVKAVEVEIDDKTLERGIPQIVFHLRNPKPAAGDVVRYAIDGKWTGSPVTNARGPVPFDATNAEPLTIGTHVLTAVVTTADGTPYTNEGASLAIPFHVRERSGEFGYRDKDGNRHEFHRDDPCLIVIGPEPDAAGSRVIVTAANCALGEGHRIRLVHDGAVTILKSAAVHHAQAWKTLEIELQHDVGGEDEPKWETVPGVMNRWTRTNEAGS